MSLLSHEREQRAKRSHGNESGEQALPLNFALTAAPRAFVLQREPARSLAAAKRSSARPASRKNGGLRVACVNAVTTSYVIRGRWGERLLE